MFGTSASFFRIPVGTRELTACVESGISRLPLPLSLSMSQASLHSNRRFSKGMKLGTRYLKLEDSKKIVFDQL